MKYIFVTGGVVSGLGKGISAASIGRLLKARGYKVTAQKLDPYINVDPGHDVAVPAWRSVRHRRRPRSRTSISGIMNALSMKTFTSTPI